MRDEAKFKLRVDIDKFLNGVVVIAKRKHFVDQELKTEVSG